ncbi:phosphoribosylformylglycinamidine synthase I [Anoxybacter fermentans]|uniref:Phosphoribosylformylglycinamidine synthase subunit PurQ n=1 Tax=Anoxybacter fermentans TaxID=1323375 RepID=A0A3Q9HTT3_9FIRM|nr:phosphoribosylformylglycinamidine synthase I [Anoxybacter fermentans]AZR74234.1 phosphoribosylformylglycinamidine synthase I [Anoxybacter fermentans]
MHFGIIVFPGSNCDHDCKYAVEFMGHTAEYLWHADRVSLDRFDCIIIPGGFSYGDYLRAGAIARFAPIMEEVQKFARKGGLVIGICNGFQILLEAGLLPGAMQKNRSLKFQCEYIYLRVENADTPFTNQMRKGEVIQLPIAHGEGNYYLNPEEIAKLEANGQILLRYATPEGEVTDEVNPNGSISNIAGIVNESKNIFGLMPHPERAVDDRLGNGCIDGRKIFNSIIAYLTEKGELPC